MAMIQASFEQAMSNDVAALIVILVIVLSIGSFVIYNFLCYRRSAREARRAEEAWADETGKNRPERRKADRPREH